ncbi:bgs3 [Symbiodinium natans]|uniref:Bgs3 protein n=1 Tax=Symbiodinium natans TaxID=878477 RepID=A0A812I7N9_9DINO|nr:bgs3 [Symbiodinium natans]
MQDASACANIAQCGDCVVHCNCGGARPCLGSNTTLRCLGADDPVRSLLPVQLPNGQFPLGECDASASAGTVGLVAPDLCGPSLCCPASPFVPAGCQNDLDARLGMTGQCQAMVDSGSFSCEASFCPTCGQLAGQCDQLCGYGLCAVCGDCFPSARLGLGRPDTCDDGNAQDGDGCSSSCQVEDGWTCTKQVVSVTDMTIGVQTVTTIDRCTTCTDSPVAWVDSQGYTCEDYKLFGACDANSLSSDALVLGGRIRSTPEYFRYQFLYNIEVTPSNPLKMLVSVAAANDAHIFLGKPGEYGFEIVIGGWNNGLSVLKMEPTQQTLGNHYGRLLSESEMRTFWVYYAWDGNLSVGQGEVFWENATLWGSTTSIHVVSSRNWYDSTTQISLLNEVYISTGWHAVGAWDVRLKGGFAGVTLGSLADGSGIDATSACCVCGGGVSGRPCEQRDPTPVGGGELPFQARGDVIGSTEGSRRLSGLGGFASDPLLLGKPSTDGFSLNLNFTSCTTTQQSDPSGDWCILEVAVVPAVAKNRVMSPLANVWTQVLDPGCRLMNHHQVGSSYSWQATGCNFTSGALYAAALHLTTGQGDVLLLIDLQIPGIPTYTPSSVFFSDSDVRRGYLLGEVTVQGAEDESNILQYRAYFGRSNDTRVNFLADARAAGIGWVNTYSGGGLRNGFNNECLYGDCSWKMQLSRTAGNGQPYSQYIIRHDYTGLCLCYANSVLSRSECYANLLTLNSPMAYKYTPSGNGALVDRNNNFYKTIWYRDIGDPNTKTMESVKAVMQQVCDDYTPCVGFLIAETNLDGIILLDRTYGTDEYPGLWPPEIHPALLAVGAEAAWSAYGDSQALSPANPTRTSLDIVNDPMWQPWLAFIKEKKDPDCLWSLQDRIFNSTVESRLKSSASAACLCQVPETTETVGADGVAAPAADDSVHKPHIGKFCDAMWMDFTVDGQELGERTLSDGGRSRNRPR